MYMPLEIYIRIVEEAVLSSPDISTKSNLLFSSIMATSSSLETRGETNTVHVTARVIRSLLEVSGGPRTLAIWIHMGSAECRGTLISAIKVVGTTNTINQLIEAVIDLGLIDVAELLSERGFKFAFSGVTQDVAHKFHTAFRKCIERNDKNLGLALAIVSLGAFSGHVPSHWVKFVPDSFVHIFMDLFLKQQPALKRHDLDFGLIYAVEAGSLKMSRSLIEHGADVSSNDNRCLLSSCFRGTMDIMRLLISNGADVQARANRPLIDASFAGRADVVSFLIERGAYAMDQGGLAMTHAINNGHDNVVEVLHHCVNK